MLITGKAQGLLALRERWFRTLTSHARGAQRMVELIGPTTKLKMNTKTNELEATYTEYK